MGDLRHTINLLINLVTLTVELSIFKITYDILKTSKCEFVDRMILCAYPVLSFHMQEPTELVFILGKHFGLLTMFNTGRTTF